MANSSRSGIFYPTALDNRPQNVVRLLYKHQLKLATAESCTGGMISALITSVPGSSEVFDFGVCTYSNEMKLSVLGIDPRDLAEHGVVSDPIARQMARGVRRLAKAGIGLSTTGIAGPGGGTPEKPVGTVYISASAEWGELVSLLQLNGDREAIRTQTSAAALDLATQLIDIKENSHGKV